MLLVVEDVGPEWSRFGASLPDGAGSGIDRPAGLAYRDAVADPHELPMTASTTPPADEPTPAEKVLGAIGGVEALAIGMTRQATEFAADLLPTFPGFPGDALDAPTAIVDKVFETVEDALAPRSSLARDVVHQQGTFVKGMFDSVQPIVDALAGRRGRAAD